MNRRAFIQGLIGLASMPALSKYINVFKLGGVREGITQAADTTMSKGIEFYEAVIKRVMDEGTVTGEADRFRTYKHPDKPDISVELNVGTGDTAVYFDTDRGSRAGAEITSDIEMPRAGKELMENEEVYRMGGDDYYKDIDEEITGGVGSLEEWIKMKRGYAAGGRVGMWMGGPLSAGKSTLREMLRHFSKGSSHGKSGAEMLKMVNPKQFSRHLEDPNLLFMKGSNKEGLMATDMVKDMVRKVEGERATMIDELLSAAKNIRKADKSLEQYKLEMIEVMMAKGSDRQTAEKLAEMVSKMAEGAAGKSATPNITDAGLLELETIHKNLLTKGRALNAAGGRVGMWKGGMPRGLMAALKTIRGKFGDDAIKTVEKDAPTIGFQDDPGPVFNIKRPESAITRDKFKNFGKPGKFNDDGTIDYQYYAEHLNDSENTFVYGDETIEELEGMLKERFDYYDEMKAQYDRGELDKYAPSLADEVNDDQIRAAVDDIFPTGDYKYDAQMAAEALVENNPQIFGNKLLDDLDQKTQTKIYGLVLEVVQGDMGKMLQMKRLSKPTKTLEGIEKTGTINISDDAVAEEFSRFMKESDPTGFKDLEQKVELSNFNPKGRKKNAGGGRVGFKLGGIFRGLKGIQLGRVQKDLINKYKNEGMEFIDAVTKGTDEGAEIVNHKKLNFLQNKLNEININSDEYVDLIDEHIRIVEPDFYKDIKRWDDTRPDLADKTRALFFPDWAEARYGEDYLDVLDKNQARAIQENIDPNFKEPLSSQEQMVSDIDDMNKANIDDLFGIRKKNAQGGIINLTNNPMTASNKAGVESLFERR